MVGFDIGASYLKIAVCDDGKVKQGVSVRLPENYVKDGRVVSVQAMAEFIKKVAVQNKIKESKCAIVLSDSETYLRSMTMPAIAEDKLKLNLPYEFRSYVGENKDKYIYDYMLEEMKYDDDGIPAEMDILTSATLQSTIETFRLIFKKAGFKLIFASPQACAGTYLIRNSMKYKSFPEAGEITVLIDLGHTQTRVFMYNGDRFDVERTVEIGCVSLDNAISDLRSVDVHIAATYKEENYNDILDCEECQEMYRRTAVEILKTVNFYMFNNKDHEIKNVILSGGGSKIESLRNVIEETLSMPVMNIDTLIFTEPAKEGEVQKEIDYSMLQYACGVALC